MISATITVEDPVVAEAVQDAEAVLVKYEHYEIVGQPDYDAAGELLREIKGKMGRLNDMQKEITGPINESLKRVRALFNAPLGCLERAEGIIRRARLAFMAAQEKKRADEAARLKELAAKEEAKKKAALETKAARAEAKGDSVKAEALREQKAAVFVPAPIVAPKVERTAGIGIRKDWKARVVDPMLVPREFLVVDLVKLGKYARTMKEMARVPGVEFYAVDVEVVGRGEEDIFGRNKGDDINGL